jgi:hypothetical protein
MNILLINWVESKLEVYQEAGADFVVIYKHRLHDELMFVEAYPTWEKYNAARKYWQNEGYLPYKTHDLSYNKWLKEYDETVSNS